MNSRSENSRKLRGWNTLKAMEKIFSNVFDEDYLIKDTELADKFGVTRLTISNIRNRLGVPKRTERILERLKTMDTSKYTIADLSKELNIKYQNIYKIVTGNGIKYKKL